MAEWMKGAPDFHVEGSDTSVGIAYVGVNMGISGLW